MISASDRETAVLLIDEAIVSGDSYKRHVTVPKSRTGLSIAGKSERQIETVSSFV